VSKYKSEAQPTISRHDGGALDAGRIGVEVPTGHPRPAPASQQLTRSSSRRRLVEGDGEESRGKATRTENTWQCGVVRTCLARTAPASTKPAFDGFDRHPCSGMRPESKSTLPRAFGRMARAAIERPAAGRPGGSGVRANRTSSRKTNAHHLADSYPGLVIGCKNKCSLVIRR